MNIYILLLYILQNPNTRKYFRVLLEERLAPQQLSAVRMMLIVHTLQEHGRGKHILLHTYIYAALHHRHAGGRHSTPPIVPHWKLLPRLSTPINRDKQNQTPTKTSSTIE